MKNIFFTIVLITAFSCASKNNIYLHMKELADDSLKSAIKKYIDKTSFDAKTQFISVDCLIDYNKTSYDISKGKSKLSYRVNPPDYFSVIDNDVVILLWTTNGEIFKLDSISNEIDKL